MKSKQQHPKRYWLAITTIAVLAINLLIAQVKNEPQGNDVSSFYRNVSNAPTITCPEDIVIQADANCSAIVDYEITAEASSSGGSGSTPTEILFASAQENKVYIANLDGSDSPTVFVDPATARNVIGLFADYTNNKLYMSNGGGPAKGTYVAPLSGGVTGVKLANSDPNGNTQFYTYVDTPNSRYFFTNPETNGVYVANLDGTGAANQVFVSGSAIGDVPHGIDYDPETNQLYIGAWSFSSPVFGGIWRIDVATGVSSQIYGASDGLSGIRGLQIDTTNNKIYWAEHDGGGLDDPTGAIKSANLDGTGNIQTIAAVDDVSPDYVFIPADVILDPSTGILYWSEFDTVITSRLRKKNADGSGTVETVFTYTNNDDGGYMRGLAFATEATSGGGGGEITITQTDDSGYTSGDAFPLGTTIQEYTVTDSNGNTAVCSFTVTVQDNDEPVIVDCPSTIEQANDAGECGAVVTWTEPTANDNCTSSDDLIWVRSHLPGDFFPVGTTTVTYSVTDASGNTSSICSFDVIVTNVLPENVNGIIGGNDPIQAGTEFSLSADFMDDNLVSANWFFSSNGDFTNGDTAEYSYTGTISGAMVIDDFIFDQSQTGVYTVKVVVEDACGETTEELYNYVVIYDSSGGFVTGGGYIDSPAGALVGTTTEGKANFGLVAKYSPGNNTISLDGNTNFKFKNGDFHFKSNQYEEMSLVISGERKATYRGSGSINGVGGYEFMVTVIDGDAPGAGPLDTDSFRIKIWTSGSPNDVIYDNEIGTPENGDSSTALGGGSIVIHKPRGNSNARTANILDDSKKYGNNNEFDLISWPNPSNTYFNLSIRPHNLIDNIDLYVLDVMGKIVHQETIGLDKSYKFGENLQSGIYFVRITQGFNTKMIRIIKQ